MIFWNLFEKIVFRLKYFDPLRELRFRSKLIGTCGLTNWGLRSEKIETYLRRFFFYSLFLISPITAPPSGRNFFFVRYIVRAANARLFARWNWDRSVNTYFYDFLKFIRKNRFQIKIFWPTSRIAISFKIDRHVRPDQLRTPKWKNRDLFATIFFLLPFSHFPYNSAP